MWTKLQAGLIVLALILVFAGDRLSIPLLSYTGVACLGIVAMVAGWEAIVTQQIVVGRRRRGNRGTYVGMPAVFQGIQFNVFGFFLISAVVATYVRANVREYLLQWVRRPGLPLVVLGILVLMQAAVTISGSLEQRDGPRSEVIFDLLVARLFPGVILIVIGLAVLGLGLFEIVAPNVFDSMGGGVLEMLYGLR
jgi:hypothetical protein